MVIFNLNTILFHCNSEVFFQYLNLKLIQTTWVVILCYSNLHNAINVWSKEVHHLCFDNGVFSTWIKLLYFILPTHQEWRWLLWHLKFSNAKVSKNIACLSIVFCPGTVDLPFHQLSRVLCNEIWENAFEWGSDRAFCWHIQVRQYYRTEKR